MQLATAQHKDICLFFDFVAPVKVFSMNICCIHNLETFCCHVCLTILQPWLQNANICKSIINSVQNKDKIFDIQTNKLHCFFQFRIFHFFQSFTSKNGLLWYRLTLNIICGRSPDSHQRPRLVAIHLYTCRLVLVPVTVWEWGLRNWKSRWLLCVCSKSSASWPALRPRWARLFKH